jgi:hypothetical protein
MNDESTPKGAHESATTTPSVTAGADFTAEDRHAAYCAGYDDGMHHRLGLETEERARALLLAWSNESRDMAMRYASRVGPNWAAMVAGDLDER